jgi:glycosyltransferase involved in cell wall biosynthesis
MRIACVTPSAIPSTTANSIQAVKACHALASLGHSVRLFCPGNGAIRWQDLVDNYELTTPFEISKIPSNPGLKRYDFTWKCLRPATVWKADLMYTWLPQFAWLAGVYGFPSVLEIHDRITGKLGPWFFRQYLNTWPDKRVLVITRALKMVLECQTGQPFAPDVVTVAPNGVELDKYQNLPDAASARSKLDLPPRFTAVYTGHFYPGRGMDLLLELAKRLAHVSFVWVGGKPEDVAFWKNKVETGGIKNVVITGFIPKAKLPLYQAAGDVLLMPYETAIAGSSGGNSAEICSPMKMFDYLASGRVIISSELPVLHEVLNENNAIFCPPTDAAAWVNALQTIQREPDKMAALSKQSRLDASRYSWQNRAKLALSGME